MTKFIKNSKILDICSNTKAKIKVIPGYYQLLEEGIYVIGFFYPVVAKGQARIRVQLSAAHEQHHLDKAIAAFTTVGKKLNILK